MPIGAYKGLVKDRIRVGFNPSNGSFENVLHSTTSYVIANHGFHYNNADGFLYRDGSNELRWLKEEQELAFFPHQQSALRYKNVYIIIKTISLIKDCNVH